MSGVELIVGSVLGTIPIALEIYDRSGRVFEVFSSFRQYPREVLILETKLGAQRTIFRSNAVNLLTAITKDRVQVQGVLDKPSSHAARLGLVMSPLYLRRLDTMDEAFVSCRQTAERINEALQRLCSQAEAFRAEVGEKQDKTSPTEWLRHVKTRFRLGLNKPRIAKAIDELRDFNQDFGLITDHITKALHSVLNELRDETPTRKSARSINILQRYHRFRYASKALYSTLQAQWVCQSHRCHCFDVRILDSSTASSSTRYVTCELAVTHDGSNYGSRTPLRLEIQQSCADGEDHDEGKYSADGNGSDKQANMRHLAKVLETSSEKLTVASTQKHRKDGLKDFAATSTSSPPQLPDIDLTQSLAYLHLAAPTDLSQLSDICKSLHEAMTVHSSRSLIGTWRNPVFGSAEWFCVPSVSDAQTTAAGVVGGASQSLSDIIAWIAEDPVFRALPRPSLFQLAGAVAEGIMQFYSTPWLPQDAALAPDLGRSVRYFHPALAVAVADTDDLQGPYFMSRLEQPAAAAARGKAPLRAVADNSSGSVVVGGSVECRSGAVDFSEARNKLLFNFGILLLEIGYGMPWADLRKRAVAKAATTNPPDAAGGVSDYKVAEKLAQQLVRHMGPAYPRIVRKCLGCDFGLGETDLDNEDLQRRFLEDVVTGLRTLREDLRRMPSYS